MQIIIKKSPQEMLEGIELDSKQIQRVKLAIYGSVETSFKERQEIMNDAEATRRIDFCFGQALQFIGDLGYTVKEVEHYLPTALRCNLIGIEYQPAVRTLDREPMI